MLNAAADVMLLFSQPLLLLVIILLGLFTRHRTIFLHVLFLCTLDIILNVALKGSFKIPLQAPLTGYAFPSGHMQLASVFYLWLGLHYTSWLFRSLVIFILFGIGAGLIHHGYHQFYEVLGGLVVALILIKIYTYLALKFPKTWVWTVLGLGSVAMIYNGFVYHMIPPHAWRAYCILLALSLGYALFMSLRS